MSGQQPTFQQLLQETGDSVQGVLDQYRQRDSGVLRELRPLIFDNVKQLFNSIQKYEQKVLMIESSLLGVKITPLRSTQGLLHDCALLGKRLQRRVEAGTFRDERGLREEVRGLNEAIWQLIASDEVGDVEGLDHSAQIPHAPQPPHTSTNYPPGDLDAPRPFTGGSKRLETPTSSDIRMSKTLSSVSALRAENSDLRHENALLQARLTLLEHHDHAKLYHIKRLHSAIRSLNIRHPTSHRPRSWEDLTEELPYLIDHIDSVNEVLKQLENQPPTTSVHNNIATSTTPSQTSGHHAATRSTPTSPIPPDSVIRSFRPPSPTESNVSSLTSTKEKGRTQKKSQTPAPKHVKRKATSGGGERRSWFG